MVQLIWKAGTVFVCYCRISRALNDNRKATPLTVLNISVWCWAPLKEARPPPEIDLQPPRLSSISKAPATAKADSRFGSTDNLQIVMHKLKESCSDSGRLRSLYRYSSSKKLMLEQGCPTRGPALL